MFVEKTKIPLTYTTTSGILNRLGATPTRRLNFSPERFWCAGRPQNLHFSIHVPRWLQILLLQTPVGNPALSLPNHTFINIYLHSWGENRPSNGETTTSLRRNESCSGRCDKLEYHWLPCSRTRCWEQGGNGAGWRRREESEE
jgi:hypothetical protein